MGRALEGAAGLRWLTLRPKSCSEEVWGGRVSSWVQVGQVPLGQ